jgi:hypothetical protein
LGVGWLLFEGGFDGVGDDFWDVSLGNNALYISFLRGFSVAMRSVFTGASEDVFEVGRDGSGKFSFGSFRVPSGSACTSFAAGWTVSFGRLDDAEGGGGCGFTNDGGSGLCEPVVFGASRAFSCGIEGFVNLGGSDARA